MAYRIVINGVPIEADTMSEALALAREAGALPTGKAHRDPAPRNGAHDAKWGAFLADLTTKQVEALSLIRNGDGITIHKIAEGLGADSIAGATGVIGGGLRKNLRKHGLDHGQVIKTKTIQGEKQYFPGRLLEANDPTVNPKA